MVWQDERRGFVEYDARSHNRFLRRATVVSNSRKTFSIASLLLITTVIALHAAFPVLFEVWWICIVFAFLLFLLMSPVLVVAVLTSPPSPKGQLEIGKNRLLKWLFWLYVLLLVGCFLLALVFRLNHSVHYLF